MVRLCTIGALLGAALTAGCNGDRLYDPDGSPYLVHISDVRMAPSTLGCGLSGMVNADLQFNVTMVNTTSDTVRLEKVSSHGTLLGGSSSVPAIVFANLPFTPMVLRPHDGEATTVVVITPTCAVRGRIYLTLFLNTTAGQFATVPKEVMIGGN